MSLSKLFSPALTPLEKANLAEDAGLLPLEGGPRSAAAIALVEALYADALDPPPPRPSSQLKAKLAIGALIADLVRMEARGRWGLRSLRTKSFSGMRFGADIFRPVYRSLEAQGYVHWERGHIQIDPSASPDLPPAMWGRQSLFHLTPTFWERAAGFGIRLDDWRQHFLAAEPRELRNPPPLVDLRTEKVPGSKLKPPSLPIDYQSNPEAQRILTELEETNAFLMASGVDGVLFVGLKRIFSVSLSRHGRFYSLDGRERYEALPLQERLKALRIGGEPVAEVDIGASHLSILYGLRGQALSDEEDPYSIEAVGDREVVKSFIVTALGNGRSDLSRWSPNAGKSYLKRTGDRIGKVNPIAQVREAVLTKHPVLRGLETSQGLGTMELMFHEAEVLAKAMGSLRSRGIASLPMHDGLIVAQGAVEETKEAMRTAFSSYFKPWGVAVRPRLKVDFPLA